VRLLNIGASFIMAPKERIFKKPYAYELIAIAKNDLRAAETLAKDSLVRKETVLMMVQQAIEKSLKSLLCSLEKPIPMTHDLFTLVQSVQAVSIELSELPFALELDDLTPYASIRRYEDGIFEINNEDLKHSFKIAQEVLQWCELKIKNND
jgi:HEPN domain-containing protein